MTDEKLGFRSVLVLTKLGYDLRACYQDTFDSELPPALQQLVDRFMGYVDFHELP